MATKARDLFQNKGFLALMGVSVLFVLVMGWQILSAVRNGPPALKPPQLTRDRLQRLTAVISAFVATEQRLPNSIEEGAGKESTVDGWGHPFTFTPGTEGSKKVSFLIRSSGADGIAENDDDQTSTIRFGNDGYGKLGVESGEMVPPSIGD